MVEAVVEHAEHQQPDDRVADAAAPAEQAGAAHHHRGDGIEQEGVELVLLGRAEIGDASMPAMPEHMAEMIITEAMINLTLTPEYSAASRLPPIMYT